MLKRLRSAAFMSLGVTGGAITLFGALQPLFDMPEWARGIVLQWQIWTRTFWAWLANLIGVPIPDWLAGPLTIAVFLLLAMLGAGTRTQSYPFFHPFGALGEAAALSAMVAILQVKGASAITWNPPILLLQVAVMLLVFGLVGTITPEGFIKRVWIMFIALAMLIAGNEVLKIGDERGRVHGTIACESAPWTQAQHPSLPLRVVNFLSCVLGGR